ncbi:MAG TPA: OmpA family protein, partial [Pyrinomonadaceae bacterium]|nr:OmpA family protein [Pyrinomonadaceae bacterium]
ASVFNVTLLLEACRLLNTVHFEPDRSFIRPAAKRALRAIADFLQRSPAARRLLLVGHTDLVEAPGTSAQLSLRRTQAVLAYLTGNPPDPANPGRSMWLTLNNDENWGAREIQYILLDLGFYCHHPTNVLDGETRRAVRAAKNRFGLGNNDVVDDVFRERLFTEYIAHNGVNIPVARLLTPINSLGCAANHPIDIRGGAPFAGASERNRRVEFLIFPRPPRTTLASSTDCSQYAIWSTRCDKRLLEFIGPKRLVVGVVINPADAEEELAFLEVSNWQNAFDFDPPDASGHILPTGNAPRADFIDRDPDRFFIQITDLDRRGAGTIRARVKTIDNAGADINPFVEHELNENPNEPGVFRSNSLLLVADEIDNGEIPNGSAVGATPFRARGIANGALNDPVLRAVIDGQVVVEYSGAELGRLPVCDPDCVKTIPVSIVILRKADGTAVTSEADVQARVRRLQQNYAQCGIRFAVNVRTAAAAEMPPGVVLSGVSGITVNPGQLVDRTSLDPEERALIESPLNVRTVAGGGSTDTIQVFYANRIEGAAATAIAYPRVTYTSAAPGDDVFNLLIVGADDPEENSTLPHELCHVLLNSFHNASSNTRTNLFFEAALGEPEFVDTTVTSNKRIPEEQCEIILSNVSGVIP